MAPKVQSGGIKYVLDQEQIKTLMPGSTLILGRCLFWCYGWWGWGSGVR